MGAVPRFRPMDAIRARREQPVRVAACSPRPSSVRAVRIEEQRPDVLQAAAEPHECLALAIRKRILPSLFIIDCCDANFLLPIPFQFVADIN